MVKADQKERNDLKIEAKKRKRMRESEALQSGCRYYRMTTVGSCLISALQEMEYAGDITNQEAQIIQGVFDSNYQKVLHKDLQESGGIYNQKVKTLHANGSVYAYTMHRGEHKIDASDLNLESRDQEGIINKYKKVSHKHTRICFT